MCRFCRREGYRIKYLRKALGLALICALLLQSALPALATEIVPTEAAEAETAAATEATEATELTIPEPEEPTPAETGEDAPEAPTAHSQIPVFYQNDYAGIPYGTGTLAAEGAGMVALTMVATYMTGYSYQPDQLAIYFGSCAPTEPERIEYASSKLQLVWRRAESWEDTMDALGKGQLVIAQMNDLSFFSESQHFLLLSGLTADGNILVRDPNASNQSIPALAAGYDAGFAPSMVSWGYTAGWIYDPDAMPELPFLYTGEPEPTREMPQYNQLDYPNVRYGEGSIATSGCSITSLAMVATYMTGHTYLPDELADYFGGYIGSNVDRMLHASTELKLPWYPAYNWLSVRDALEEGNLAIIMVDGRSMFTNSQHFLVAYGLTEHDRVLIRDSYSPNYSKWILADGFENGFTAAQLCAGYCGAWIYDLKAMPDDPYIYVPEEKPYVEPRYPDIHMSAADLELLARMVWVEARGECFDGQQAVAEVVLNRVVSPDFPNSIHDVVYADGQFRSTKFLDDATHTQTQYEAVEQALYGPYVLPKEVVHFAQYAVNQNTWGKIGGHIFCYPWSPPDT